MSYSLLNMTMARRTQSNKVTLLMGYIYNQVVTSPVNMVDMQSSSIGIAFCPTQSAYLIAFEYLFSYLVPTGSMHQPSTAKIVRVLIASMVVFTAFVRAELASTLSSTCKVHKSRVTVSANVLLLSMFPYICTRCRAVLDSFTFGVEHLAANGARNIRALIGFSPLLQTARSTEEIFTILVSSHAIVWTLKLLTTIRTSIHLGFYLCGKLTFSSTIHRRRSVSLKLFIALETHLEHC